MKSYKSLVLCIVVLVVSASVQLAAGVRPSDNSTVVEFNTMAPVTPPYTGNTNPIRGIPGGGILGRCSQNRQLAHTQRLPVGREISSRSRDSSHSCSGLPSGSMLVTSAAAHATGLPPKVLK